MLRITKTPINLILVQKLLSDSRVNINHKNKNGDNLLSLACRDNNEELIEQLLTDPRLKLDNNLPLYHACDNGNLKVVQLLLTYNKDNCMNINTCISYFDKETYNPLLVTSKKLLQRYGLLQKIKPQTSLFTSIISSLFGISDSAKKAITQQNTFIEIIKCLLKDPFIDINTKNSRGLTALHLCCINHELLTLLLQHSKESINTQITKSYIGAYWDDNHHFREEYKKGSTPLHILMQSNGPVESVVLLLDNGANISIKNEKNQSAPKLCRNFRILKYLLEKNYIVQENLNNDNYLVDHIHSWNNEIPQLLLAHGADPNKINKDSDKFSPLFAAAESDSSLLNLFLDKFAGDYHQVNTKGETVLFKAFMSQVIIRFYQINLLEKMKKEEEKKKYMMHELSAAVQYAPKNIFSQFYIEGIYRFEYNKRNALEKFNLFIKSCIEFGKIDITENCDGKSLLDHLYENIQKRSASRKTHALKCMHPDNNYVQTHTYLPKMINHAKNAIKTFPIMKLFYMHFYHMPLTTD